MIEPGVGEFAFAHRSLQEYLAGRYLLNVNYPAMAIAEHLADTHWREPILLALGHASMHSNLSDFEKLLDNILSFDPARSAFLPSATMLLADAYFEIAEFPERVRLLLFERLFSQYCSVPGELAPFSRFVEEFFSSVWGRSAIDSNEELAVEDLLVRALSHGDQPIALRAATLVHQCRIYSNSIAEALVAAQRIDSPELQWSIHRFLHVLVSRGEIESHLRFTPITRTVTDLNLNPELVEGLREVAQGMRILEIPPGRRKMRQKVQQLALSNLHFRTYLLEHPELAARIAESPSWCSYIGALGIGGFGDFETRELASLQAMWTVRCKRGVGSPSERLAWAEQLDTYVNPLLNEFGKHPSDFRPEWLVRDPFNWPDIVDQLEQGKAPPRSRLNHHKVIQLRRRAAFICSGMPSIETTEHCKPSPAPKTWCQLPTIGLGICLARIRIGPILLRSYRYRGKPAHL